MLADHHIIHAMRRYGGKFVQALALAASVADSSNLAKLKSAFPEYWQKYTEMAAATQAQEEVAP